MAGYMGGCSYRNCYKRRSTCSSVTFFPIPNDERRQIWIENSGNSLIKNLTEKQIRFLCEHHFHKEDIQEQHGQKILTETAIPIVFPKKPVIVKTRKNKKRVTKAKKNKCDTLEIHILDNEQDSNLNDTMVSFDDSSYCKQESIDVLNSDDKEESNQLLNNNKTISEETIEILMETEDTTKDMLDENNQNKSEDEFIKILTVCNESTAIENENQTEEVFREIASEDTQISLKSKTIPNGDFQSDEHIEFVVKCSKASKEVQTVENMSTFQTAADYESDRHFALSLTNYFQRLNSRKKAKAKIDILNYFHKLEFNEDAVL